MRRRLLLLALPAAAALTGCRTGDSAPERNSLVDSRDRSDPRSLDPAHSTDVPTGRAVGYVFEGLTRFTPDAAIEPALATRWDVAADGLTYTFHLRPGVTFTDGTPVTAAEVLASLTRVLAPATRAERQWPLMPIRGAKEFAAGSAPSVTGMRAVDDSTVQFTLTEPFAAFPKLLAMPVAAIVPAKTGPDFGQHPVGTGPWTLVEWKHDDYLKFAANPKYWGGRPKTDTLVARIIPEPSTAVAEFESGNVDVLDVPEQETRQWQETDEKKARLQSAPSLRLWYVGINMTRGPLADVRVRQAINYAIDSKAILERLVGNRGRLAAGVIPPTLEGADTLRAPYPHDVAKAKALLAAAGHPGGIDLELWVGQDATFVRVAQTIQSYLAEAGIRAKLVQRDSPSVREAARSGSTDLVLKDWYADYPDAESFLYPLLHSSNAGAGGNVSFYKSAAYDSLVIKGRRELDATRRAALYRAADSTAHVDAPMVTLFFYKELYAVQPWVGGFQVPTVFNGQRWTTVGVTGAK